jgi:uncharacterized membrane protein
MKRGAHVRQSGRKCDACCTTPCGGCAQRAASMNVVAAYHFNRGQRAFFFALAYPGWFMSGYVLIVSTAAVLFVMWRCQFASDALAAIMKRPSQSDERLP